MNYEEVKRALLDFDNQDIIFLAPELKKYYKDKNKERLQKLIEKKNKEVFRWIAKVENKLLKEKLSLPKYKMNLLDIPPGKESELHKILQEELPFKDPRLKTSIQVKRFCHVDKNRFEITIESNRVEHQLPVYLTSKELQFKQQQFEFSYLVLAVDSMSGKLDMLKFEWGRNLKFEEYEKQYNEVVERFIAGKLESLQKEIDSIKDAKNKGLIINSMNLNRAGKTARDVYGALLSTGVDPKFINALLDASIDECQVFGCVPVDWQLILLREIFSTELATDEITVEIANKWLSRVGLVTVQPFRKLMFETKFLKFCNVKIPFDSAYKVISLYFRVLLRNWVLFPKEKGVYLRTELTMSYSIKR